MVFVVGVAASIVSLRSSPAVAAPVQVLVSTHPVVSLSASGGYLAWRTRVPEGRVGACWSVHRLRLVTDGAVPIRRCPVVLVSSLEQGGGVYADGPAVFWNQRVDEYSGGQLDPLVREWVAQFPHRPRVVHETGFAQGCSGDQVTALDAGGGLLAYSVLHYDEVDPAMDCQLAGLPGSNQATGGALWLVSGRNGTPQVLAGARPSAFMAAAGSLLATVPYSLPSPVDQPPAVSRTVEIWDTSSATRKGTVTPAGRIIDMDFNGRVLALLVVDMQGTERLVRYNATGLKLGSTPLATGSVRRISMGASIIAYAVGHRIVAMTASAGGPRTLWRATRKPRLVTVGSGHVYWVSRSRQITSLAM
jgi:hypothetical protein